MAEFEKNSKVNLVPSNDQGKKSSRKGVTNFQSLNLSRPSNVMKLIKIHDKAGRDNSHSSEDGKRVRSDNAPAVP